MLSIDYWKCQVLNQRIHSMIKVLQKSQHLKTRNPMLQHSASKTLLAFVRSSDLVVFYLGLRKPQWTFVVDMRISFQLQLECVTTKQFYWVVVRSAQAYMELEKAGPIDLIEKNRLQYFYDRFFMNRIGIRTLIYQHS